MPSVQSKLRPLADQHYELSQSSTANAYAQQLLSSLGAQCVGDKAVCLTSAISDWALSGLMPLTGLANGTPQQGPGAIPSCADGALNALCKLAVSPELFPKLSELNGMKMLSERAALMGLSRQGPVSANGSCHIIRAHDGWLALNLVRDDDWSLLQAWLQRDEAIENWRQLEERTEQQVCHPLIDQGRLLGLALAPLQNQMQNQIDMESWYQVVKAGKPRNSPTNKVPLVVDLTSLWAGPLCTQLLNRCGARVIKVESRQRPDGARRGNPTFYDLMNAGKESFVVDFSCRQGRLQLSHLLAQADIVIEASRPRALQQLGIDAESFVEQYPGLVWLSITGYGRTEPQANWIAFGDDAAVAAGIYHKVDGVPVFCGDAIADPLTGLHAALAALAFYQSGSGVLLDLSLQRVAAYSLNFCPTVPKGILEKQSHGWRLRYGNDFYTVANPQARHAWQKAAGLGCHTESLRNEFKL